MNTALVGRRVFFLKHKPLVYYIVSLTIESLSLLSLQEVIPTFDMAVNELFFERFPDSVLEHQIQVRPYSAVKTRNMRALNPEGKKPS